MYTEAALQCAGAPSEVSLFVVVKQAEDVVFGEAFAAFQEIQLDGKGQAGDLSAQLLHQLDGGFHGAAGGE